MEFRDPRILGPSHKELDTAVKAGADLIVAAVVRHEEKNGQPNDGGWFGILGELRALDLIDAAFARRRDTQEGTAGRTLAEREHDVAIDRVRRDVEQLLRTSAAVAKERGEDQHRALADATMLIHDQTTALRTWVGTEIVPDLPEAGV